jgi:hypothetical protein
MNILKKYFSERKKKMSKSQKGKGQKGKPFAKLRETSCKNLVKLCGKTKKRAKTKLRATPCKTP